jgi:hypothetical protein
LPAQVEVLDLASLPQRPSSPNRAAIVAAGLAIGLSLGIVVLGVRRWPLVAVSGAAAAIVVGCASFLIPQVWISTSVLSIASGADPAPLIQTAFSDANLARIIQNPAYDLYRAERSGMPIGEVAARMRNHDIRVVPLPNATRNPNAFAVSFRCEDPRKSQAVVHELVAMLAGPQTLTVLDPASLPQPPAEPNRRTLTAFSLAAGLLIGSLATFLRRPRALDASAA